MKPVPFELVYQVPAPPERVWPILADTERLNRQIGLPPTEPCAVGGEPVRVARVKARMAGFPVVWEEDPFDFVEGSFFWVRRRIVSGPILQFNGGMRLAPDGEGTEVRVQSEFLPRNALGQALVQAICAKSRGDFDRLFSGLRAHLAGERETPYGEGVDLAPPAARQATLARLRAADPEFLRDPLAPRLCEHLASSGDTELVRIRPFALARQWGEDRYAVLRLCLLAAARKVLDLSWDLLCPNCRGAKNRWQRLEDVRSQAHCDDCQISFDANFDRVMEVTFRPNAGFRRIEGLIYCSGGPRNTPHIVAQTVVAPGETARLQVRLAPGRYRLRNLTAELAATLFVDMEGESASCRAVLEADGLRAGPEAATLRAGETTLECRNGTGQRQQLILERLGLHEDMATAAVVSVYEEFRNLFSSELLSPRTQMGIQSLALMFTDLKGSTALYSVLGDAAAYALVRAHFELLEDLVRRHGGGIIKTIGDSVMGAFPTTDRAVACALELHAELERFNQEAPYPIRLKVGLHEGSCIAARSYDERLDYYGGAVNLAARTHEQSRGDDFVVTEAVMRNPDAASLLAGARCEPFEADLRGLGKVTLYRVLPYLPQR